MMGIDSRIRQLREWLLHRFQNGFEIDQTVSKGDLIHAIAEFE